MVFIEVEIDSVDNDEVYEYGSLELAIEGMRQLADICCRLRAEDGIDRRIILNINWDNSERDT